MKVLGKEVIRKFSKRHSNARPALSRWVSVVEASEWSNHADLKLTFPSADYIGDRLVYVFNLGGNSYRLVAKVPFEQKFVIVREVMTHAEYDKW